jgi:hypothetical protein
VQKISEAFAGNDFVFFFDSTVQAKLRSLHEYHQRLLHNTLPAPTGIELSNTIKYFSQTLLSKLSRLGGFEEDID